MSVLANRRRECKSEYLNTANQIDSQVLNLASMLSARYGRLLGNRISMLSGTLCDLLECANSAYPSDDMKYRLRYEYLVRSRGAIKALDVELGRVYNVLMTNPAGAFVTGKDRKAVSAAVAESRLDIFAEETGLLIDKLINMINAMLDKYGTNIPRTMTSMDSKFVQPNPSEISDTKVDPVNQTITQQTVQNPNLEGLSTSKKLSQSDLDALPEYS